MTDGPARSTPASDSEVRLAFLLRLSDALRTLDDADRIEEVASRILGEELGADRVGFGQEPSADGDVVVKQDYAVGVPSIAGRHHLEDFGAGLLERFRAGEIIAYDDVANAATIDEPNKLAHARLCIGATFTVPLLQAGILRAIFFVHFRAVHRFSASEVGFLQETAERAWRAIEHAQAAAALRNSEARLAAALESVPVGVAVLDTCGRIVIANSEYRKFLPTGIIPSRDPERSWRWNSWDESGRILDKQDFPGARAIRGERVVPGQEMLYVNDLGQEVWTRVASVPIHDRDGNIVSIASAVSDIDVLKRGADALRESRARAELLINGIAQATWEAASDGTVEVDSPTWRAFTGQSYEQWRGIGWADAIHPDDRESTVRKWRRTVSDRQPVDAEYRLRAADGSYRWMNVRAVPLVDETGRIEKWLGMNIDIDGRKRLEESLYYSERRTRALVEGVPQLLWRADRSMQWSWASPQWTGFTGQSASASRGQGWLAMVHPDDRDAVLSAWTRAEVAGGFDVEHRLHGKDGMYRWFSTRALPVREDTGVLVEWFGTSNDIHALRAAQDKQAVLVSELQHRTRNLIAVVRSLSDSTAQQAASLPAFQTQFGERLAALSRVQGLLSQTASGRKVTFDEVLRSELLAFGAISRDGDDDPVTLAGPKGVLLPSGSVQIMALALHELATNAVKHGALSTATGRLNIAWSVEHGPTGNSVLRVEWLESGVDLPDAEMRVSTGGYGRELIERALPYQLAAKTSYMFTADGLRCVIAVPIALAVANQEDDDG
jgi:PAS domain S-box-containing protein